MIAKDLTKEYKKVKKECKKLLNIYIDCEWGSNGNYLSLQVMLKTSNGKLHTLIIIPFRIHLLYKDYIDNTINAYNNDRNNNVDILIKPLENFTDEVLKWIDSKESLTDKTTINTHFYYSLRDLECLFGYDFFTKEIIKNHIKTLTNTKGSLHYKYNDKTIQFKLKDQYGWLKKGGLIKLCETLGIELKNKGSLDHIKSCMEKAFENEETFKIFLEYSIEDVTCLENTHKNMKDFLNKIMFETLKIPKNKLFTTENLPSTFIEKFSHVLIILKKKE